MFPHSYWIIMTQLISLLLATPQFVVKIDPQNDIGRFLGKVLRFHPCPEGDTVNRGSMREARTIGYERLCRSKDLRLIPFISRI